MMKKIYNWVLGWAESKWGSYALFFLAFAESSFFPVPPDVLLLALCAGKPSKSFFYSFLCSAGSVFGGIFGYFIGLEFMDVIGKKIISAYGFEEKMAKIGELYQQYDAWAVSIAGFTPVPYKVFTIAAGIFEISLPVFIIASLFSRSLRFFIQGTLIYFFGEKIKSFIDKYFNILVVLFVVLLVAGFVLIKFLI
ncbi:MAG: cytochrome B [Deltaproteobacteria bacterium]|nr:MAG: cytochrome B [Deltaproteobacteria bacterium]